MLGIAIIPVLELYVTASPSRLGPLTLDCGDRNLMPEVEMRSTPINLTLVTCRGHQRPADGGGGAMIGKFIQQFETRAEMPAEEASGQGCRHVMKHLA